MDSQSLRPFVHRKLFGGGGGVGKETEVGNLPEPTVRMFRCHPITLPFVSPHETEQERSKALYQYHSPSGRCLSYVPLLSLFYFVFVCV